jgi:hypothetical protein
MPTENGFSFDGLVNRLRIGSARLAGNDMGWSAGADWFWPDQEVIGYKLADGNELSR